MSPTSFQTVRLSRGSHRSPTDGVCVMELASMLAGERFSDSPSAVCPVVAMVLRAYNDAVGDERRQSLYGYAAAAVGTRAGRSVRKARMEACERFLGDRLTTHNPFFHARLRAIGIGVSAFGHAAGDSGHRAFLDLVDELLRIGGTDPMPPLPAGAREREARLPRP